MDERMQAFLLLVLGSIAIRLGFGDAALAYVKPSLQVWLVAAGAGLAIVGIHGIVRDYRQAAGTDQPESLAEDSSTDRMESGHIHVPAVAWMLVVPVLTLLLVAPSPLGSFAAGRQGATPPSMSADGGFELPEPREGAVDLSVREFVRRAIFDSSGSLDGVPVRLVGFVTPNETGDGYLLTRFVVNCCAADATAVSVEVVGDRHREPDTWLEVVGQWQPDPDHEPGTLSTEPPVIDVSSVTPVEPPGEPYEY